MKQKIWNKTNYKTNYEIREILNLSRKKKLHLASVCFFDSKDKWLK